MQFVGRVVSTVTEFYKDINPATLSGAIDVIVVEQADKELRCSPFHVRFGKLKLLRPQDKVVEVRVNGELTDLKMKVGEAGEAFFVMETDDPVPSEYATSPIPSPQKTEMDIEPLNLNDDTYSDNIDYASAHGSVDEFFSKKGFESSNKPSLFSEQINNQSTPINIKPIIKGTSYRAFHRIRYDDEDQSNMFNYHSYTEPREKYFVDENFICSSYPTSSEFLTNYQNKKFRKDIEENENPDPILKYNDISNNIVNDFLEKYPTENIKNPTIQLIKDDITQEPQEFINTEKERQWSWRWGSLPTKNMSYRPSVDALKLKQEVPNLKNYIENRNTFLTRNRSKTLSYKEKVESYLESSKDFIMNHAYTENNATNNNTLNTPFVETENALNTNNNSSSSNNNINEHSNHNLYDSNEFGLSSLLDIFENGDIQVSNCRLNDLIKLSDDAANELFQKNLLNYEKFCENPLIITRHDDLVCKINKRYFSWKVIESLMASVIFFRKPLNTKALEKLVQDQNRNRFWRPQWWKRSTPQTNNANNINTNGNNNSSSPIGMNENNNSNNNNNLSSINNLNTSNFNENNNELNSPDRIELMLFDMLSSPEIRPTRNETQSPVLSSPELTPLPVKTAMSEPAHDDYNDNNSSTYGNEQQEHKVEETQNSHYIKTLRLTSDQLKKLNLSKGVNTISFTVSTRATCIAKIYFWDMNTQVVISDVDGTITKSDVLGHLYTMVGKDWTHMGVANLYHDIDHNGYKIIYLTSRAIGQSNSTRGYLKKIEQNKYQLPDGPIIMSPDRLLKSLHREVIIKKPEDFKIAALNDIKQLWGGDHNPFYAGFGNRITDALSYKKVGVPISRIFTIDPKGDVKLELLHGFKSSYNKINELVDQIFPPINIQINNDFNDYNYWRSPIPELEIDLSIIESSLPTDNNKNNNKKDNTNKDNNTTNNKNDKNPSLLKKEFSNESFLSSLSERLDGNDSEYLSSDGNGKPSTIRFNSNQNADRKLIIRNFTDGDALIHHSDADSNSPEDLKPLLDRNGQMIGYPSILTPKEMGEDDEEDKEEELDEESRDKLNSKKVQNRRSIRDFIRRRRSTNDDNGKNGSDEEIDLNKIYRPLDDGEEIDNDEEEDEGLPINKADITAYIDDLLVKEDPSEKLDLAAYPYL